MVEPVQVATDGNQPAEETTTQNGCGSLNDLTGKIELIDDNIIFNEEFKKNVAIPYFKDIYKDLAAQSDAKSKGINKVSILNVSIVAFLSYTTLSFGSASQSHCSRDFFGNVKPRLHITRHSKFNTIVLFCL